MAALQPKKKANKNTDFHKLNPIQELILRRLNKKERYIAYFMHCFETVRILHELGYVAKRGGFQGSAIIVSITPKGEEYLKKTDG